MIIYQIEVRQRIIVTKSFHVNFINSNVMVLLLLERSHSPPIHTRIFVLCDEHLRTYQADRL